MKISRRLAASLLLAAGLFAATAPAHAYLGILYALAGRLGVALGISAGIHGATLLGQHADALSVSVPVSSVPSKDPLTGQIVSGAPGYITLELQASAAYTPPPLDSASASQPPVSGYSIPKTGDYVVYGGTFATQDELRVAWGNAQGAKWKAQGAYGCVSTDTNLECQLKMAAQTVVRPYNTLVIDVDPANCVVRSPATTPSAAGVLIYVNHGDACLTSTFAYAVTESCSSGYTLNTTTHQCDPSTAQPAADGTCATTFSSFSGYSFGATEQADPDCAALTADEVLELVQNYNTANQLLLRVRDTETGALTEVTRNPATQQTTVIRQDPAPAGTNVSSVTLDSSADPASTSSGTVTASETAVRPGAPVAAGGTAPSPYPITQTTPTPGTACGAPGQPACSVQFAPGTPGAGLDPGASSAFGSLTSGADASSWVSPVCPVDAFTFSLDLPDGFFGGPQVISDDGWTCTLSAQYGAGLRALSAAFAFIGGLFIILRA